MLYFLIGCVISGAIAGAIGRLILPGRQNIGWFATIAAGTVAAGVGTGVAYLVGFASKGWLVFLVQIALAVVCVAAVTSMSGKKSD
ncbi:GlsB/YeaQ/YmgE family stress response membrane protein [Nonomuraea rhizosphaerae]|uniref:GlsB/YeaQ/YmgE family stress response membrane protein n=1 Tax=Nonomuraea rhizosphaerae TaxID=2665663 RepID=UPI001C604F3B|nr:GlsB/YeaQ/YmgE family stress response membrane protein [Nonomuraea rhizosphaerae]